MQACTGMDKHAIIDKNDVFLSKNQPALLILICFEVVWLINELLKIRLLWTRQRRVSQPCTSTQRQKIIFFPSFQRLLCSASWHVLLSSSFTSVVVVSHEKCRMENQNGERGTGSGERGTRSFFIALFYGKLQEITQCNLSVILLNGSNKCQMTLLSNRSEGMLPNHRQKSSFSRSSRNSDLLRPFLSHVMRSER